MKTTHRGRSTVGPRTSNGVVRSGGLVGRQQRDPSMMSQVAWIPGTDLDHGDWMTAGRRLGAIGRCSQWWIGDWIRYGTNKWGERYSEAARVTGYDVASLRNMAWVASRFEVSLRNDKLTWSHHVLLAPLEEEERRRWIARAVEQKLSVADLRVELRTRDGEEKALSPAEDVREVADVVCPNCGHKMSPAD